MATISKEYTFESAHRLPNHRGKCANEHGHSYRVIVEFDGNINFNPQTKPSATGMVLDYDQIDEKVKYVIKRLDHHHLNELMVAPTAEVIALWIFIRIVVDSFDTRWRVTVCETAKTTATVTCADYQAYHKWYRESIVGADRDYLTGLVHVGVGDLLP